MTRRRWIADESSGDHATLTGENARHLAQALRARVGQQFDIAVDGRVRLGTITSVADERVEFALGVEVEAVGQTFGVELLLAVFKFDRMEWVIEKATELGVAAITPVITRRTEPHLATASAKRVERWRKIAKEAAQQSRRADVPEIREPMKLKSVLDVADARMKIVLAEDEKTVTLGALLSEGKHADGVVMAVGPEGGWTPDELKLFSENGWLGATLGPTILRAETAAIAALAVASAEIHRSQ